MGDIELVIKIPEEIRKSIFDGVYCGIIDKRVFDAIKNGIPLPKGHGRLIDADAVLEEPFGSTYKDVNTAETIIEADRKSEDKECLN